jgi:lipopolysaccharide export LptBFGC system permease protein LptF
MKDKGDDEPRVLRLRINWGRVVIVVPVLAFVLCLTSMVLAFISKRVVEALVMATMCGVNLGMVLVILWYTRKE